MSDVSQSDNNLSVRQTDRQSTVNQSFRQSIGSVRHAEFQAISQLGRQSVSQLDSSENVSPSVTSKTSVTSQSDRVSQNQSVIQTDRQTTVRQ